MDLEKIIDLFLEGKIKAKEVSDMFYNGKLTLNNIKDKFEFSGLIQSLNKRYKEVNNEGVMLPYDISFQDTIITLMYAIENKVKIDDLIGNYYEY